MKKLFSVCLTLIVFTITCITTYAQGLMITYDGTTKEYKGNIYKLYVNDELVVSDMPPIIIDGRSLVPVRAIFEQLGAEVEWDSKNKKVTVSYESDEVVLTINDKTALVNGKKAEMEVPAKIINDRTMVPLRFVGEQLNMEVGWDAEKGEISISNKKNLQYAKLNDIKYIKEKDRQSIAINVDKFQDYKILRLPSPDRIVVDFTNTKLSVKQDNIKVNEEFLKSIRCSQFENNTARVILDLEGQPQYRVTETEGQLLVNLEKKTTNVGADLVGVNNPLDGFSRPVDNQLDFKHVVQSTYEAIIIDVKDYKGYETFKLPDPYRIVIDIPEAIASNEMKTVNIDSTLIKSVRYAAKEPKGARLVIDTKGDHEYKLVEDDGILVAYVAKSIDLISFTSSRGSSDRDEALERGSLSVSYKAMEELETIALFTSDYSDYSIEKQLSENKIVVNLPNALGPSKEQSIDVKSSYIESIKYSAVNRTSSKVVIQLKAQCQYVVVEEEKALVINVIPSVDEDITQTDEGKNSAGKATPTPAKTATPQPSKTVAPTVTVTPVPTVVPTVTVTSNPTVVPTSTGINSDKEPIKIDHAFIDGVDSITIWAEDVDDFNVWRLTGPDRIVIDIPNFDAGREQKISVDSSNISSIRSAQFEETVGRVVVDTIGQPQFEFRKTDRYITLIVRQPTYKNIQYSNSGSRVYFTLKGAKLTEGGQNITRFYTDEYELDGRKYSVTFPSELADLGFGTININDSKVIDVKITKDDESNQTTITFTTKEPFNYEIITRESENDTTITLYKEASRKDRLVVIDPGHGGSEPGATYGGVYEKDLNLDIAKRLNALLKSHNIKTYMTREDDVYVGLYERAYIANNMNATLFVSVHNNAYYSQYSGTETLYYPSNSPGFNSKRFAQIVQEELVKALGTKNRGIVERPNLVVLKATKMPAVLAEVGFMTNEAELAKLKTEEFRQKAAQALCDAILRALEEVE